MKKRIILIMVFALLMAGSLFAETYRYCMLKENGSNNVLFLIMQTTEKLSDEQVKNLKAMGGGSFNSKQDRFAMEAGLKNVQSYYYMGALQPVFVDYTKNPIFALIFGSTKSKEEVVQILSLNTKDYIL